MYFILTGTCGKSASYARCRNAIIQRRNFFSKSLSVRHIHHHIHSAFQLLLAVGEVDDKEEKEDENEGGPDADLGVLLQPEPDRALARLPWRVLGVLKQQGSDVLELGAQIWGGKNLLILKILGMFDIHQDSIV